MKRPPYVPGTRIRIVAGRLDGRTGRVLRVITPAIEVSVDGDRTYQLITSSVRPITQERKAA